MLNKDRLFNIFKKKKEASIEVKTHESYMGDGVLDAYSGTWMFIKKWATDELDRARIFNDKKSLDIIQTSLIRGKIRLLKDLLELPKKR